MQILVGEDANDDCISCLFDVMEPRMCTQGTADWFVDRQLSGTSSAIAFIILSVAPTIDDSNPILKQAFQTVLKHAGCKDVVGSAVEESENDDSGSDDDKSGSASNEDDSDEHFDSAKTWIATLQDDVVEMDEEFIAEMEDGEIDLDVLRWMVSLLKGASECSSATRTSCKNILKKWISVDKARRPFELLSMKILKEKAAAEGIKGSTKKKLIDELIKPPADREEPELRVLRSSPYQDLIRTKSRWVKR